MKKTAIILFLVLAIPALLLGGFDAFGGGLVEKILLVEQA